MVSRAERPIDVLLVCDMEHIHSVDAMRMFNKIGSNSDHAIEAKLPNALVYAMLTSQVVTAIYLEALSSHTIQFSP